MSEYLIPSDCPDFVHSGCLYLKDVGARLAASEAAREKAEKELAAAVRRESATSEARLGEIYDLQQENSRLRAVVEGKDEKIKVLRTARCIDWSCLSRQIPAPDAQGEGE